MLLNMSDFVTLSNLNRTISDERKDLSFQNKTIYFLFERLNN